MTPHKESASEWLLRIAPIAKRMVAEMNAENTKGGSASPINGSREIR